MYVIMRLVLLEELPQLIRFSNLTTILMVRVYLTRSCPSNGREIMASAVSYE